MRHQSCIIRKQRDHIPGRKTAHGRDAREPENGLRDVLNETANKLKVSYTALVAHCSRYCSVVSMRPHASAVQPQAQTAGHIFRMAVQSMAQRACVRKCYSSLNEELQASRNSNRWKAGKGEAS
jgi:hypothetical protein